MRRALRAFRLALAFLTLWPVRFRDDEITEADIGASRFAYPLVGLLIGLALLASSELLARAGVPPATASFLLVAAWVALSGGLHLDGLADTFDGLFLPGEPGRRLAVMRDPHVGTFGVAAIVLVLLGKYAALGSLAGRPRSLTLLGAAILARTSILIVAGSAPYARPEGTGRALTDATRPRDALLALFLCLATGSILRGWPGLLAATTVAAFSWGLAQFAKPRLGGVTGDILGADVELAELSFLMVAGAIHAR